MVYDHSSNLLDQEAWTYDGDGNEITHTASDGKVTTSSYDGDNRVILKVTRDSTGNFLYQESWQYDANGNLLLYTDALGRQTQYTYDGMGRKLTETVGYGTPGAAATTYGYDADSNVTKLIDPRLNETDMVYDPLGDKISTTEVQLTQTASAAFDAAGLMTSSTNPDGSKRLYTYDGDGRLLTDTWYDAKGNLVQVNSFTYDADGNMLTASNPAGTYSFTYDGQGRLVNVNEPGGLALTFGYDENGNRTLVTDSLGGTTASSYDWANRLVGEVQSQSGMPTLTMDQSYDWAGRIASQVDEYTDGTGTHVVAQTSYGYDAKSELTSLVHKNAAGTVIAEYEYSYDNAGELSQQTDHGTTTTYGYNSAGELTSAGPANYNYDLAGNPNNTGDSTGAGNELTLDPNWAYTYDANGNITKKVSRSDSTTWLYGYDNANEMLSAKKYNADPTVPGTGATLEEDVEFKYDVFGNRIEKDATTYVNGNGTTTVQRYAYDGWNPAQSGATGNSGFEIWADLDGNSHLQTRYLRGDKIDQLFARVGTDNMPYWYKTDQQNTVRDLVNDSGTVADNIQYDAFGNIVTQTNPTLLGRYAWTGRELDTETDLQYNHARYYNPQTGRWMSQDPLGFDAGDSNLYRYLENQPTEGSDASGLYPPWRPGSVGEVLNLPGPPASKSLRFGPPGSPPCPFCAPSTPPPLRLDPLYKADFSDSVSSKWRRSLAHPHVNWERAYDLLTDSERAQLREATLAYQKEVGTNWKSAAGSIDVMQAQIAELRKEVIAETKGSPDTLKKAFPFLFPGPDQFRYFCPDYEQGYLQFVATPELRKLQIAQSLAAGLVVYGDNELQPLFSRSRNTSGAPERTPYSVPRTNDECLAWFQVYGNTDPRRLMTNLQHDPRSLVETSGDFAAVIPVRALLRVGAVGIKSLLFAAFKETAMGVAAWAAAEKVADEWGPAGAIGIQLAPAVLALLRRRLPRFRRISLPGINSSCFVAGTPLLTPHGSKPIEQFRPGDWILSRSEGDVHGPVEGKRVEHVFIRKALILRLRVAGRDIRTTAEHPFYLENRGWVCAKELKPGDRLASHDGQWVTVEAVTDLNEVATVYNLRVSDYHTYFVGSREWGFSVWAHNANYDWFVHEGVYYLRNGGGQITRSPYQTLESLRAGMAGQNLRPLAQAPSGFVPIAEGMPSWARTGLEDVARFRGELGPIPGGGLPDGGVVTRLDVGGRSFYGINGHGQATTLRANGGTLLHAEGDAFQQAANAGVRGGRGRLFVDSDLCGWCNRSGGVRSLVRSLGLESLEVVTPNGVAVFLP